MLRNIASDYSNSKLTNIREGDVQPNAVDVRLNKIFRLLPSIFELSDDMKTHRNRELMLPSDDGFYYLTPGFYEVVMSNSVLLDKQEGLPFGDAGEVITRSTLIRNGVTLHSGLYDSGYEGNIVAGMNVHLGCFRVKQGTRVGQFLLFDSEALSKYEGSYGSGKTHDERYNEVTESDYCDDCRSYHKGSCNAHTR